MHMNDNHSNEDQIIESEIVHEPSAGLRRKMELAKSIAQTSRYPQFRHGAILLKSSAIVSMASNSPAHSAFIKRFRGEAGAATAHSECAAVLNLPEHTTRNCVMFTCRINKRNQLKLGRPCRTCAKVLKFTGVRKVYYSIDENRIGCMKL